MEEPLSKSSVNPQPVLWSVNVDNDQLATPRDVAQLISRLSYLDALKVAEFCRSDVDKMVDGALEFLVTGQANGQS